MPAVNGGRVTVAAACATFGMVEVEQPVAAAAAAFATTDFKVF